MPALVAAPITKTKDTPACPTSTFTFDGAAAPPEQFAVESVIAMCAVEIEWGLVSMKGKAAPGARPANKELDATNALSAPAEALTIPAEGTRASSTTPSEIEGEVVTLFDQFRIPLLRYVLSFGLAVHDGEEVIQEVFLALFRHLTLGKRPSQPSGLDLLRGA